MRVFGWRMSDLLRGRTTFCGEVTDEQCSSLRVVSNASKIIPNSTFLIPHYHQFSLQQNRGHVKKRSRVGALCAFSYLRGDGGGFFGGIRGDRRGCVGRFGCRGRGFGRSLCVGGRGHDTLAVFEGQDLFDLCVDLLLCDVAALQQAFDRADVAVEVIGLEDDIDIRREQSFDDGFVILSDRAHRHTVGDDDAVVAKLLAKQLGNDL